MLVNRISWASENVSLSPFRLYWLLLTESYKILIIKIQHFQIRQFIYCCQRGIINLFFSEKSVFRYFIPQKKTSLVGDTEFVASKQVRVILKFD